MLNTFVTASFWNHHIFGCFLNLKVGALKGQEFPTETGLKVSVSNRIDTPTEILFTERIYEWKERFEKCAAENGNYIEKLKV